MSTDKEIIEQVNAEVIAGMISTLDFRPDKLHPSECLPMAREILAEIAKRTVDAPPRERVPEVSEETLEIARENAKRNTAAYMARFFAETCGAVEYCAAQNRRGS